MQSLTQENMNDICQIIERYKSEFNNAFNAVPEIREYLQKTFDAVSPVSRRILFGQDDSENQHYLGDFEVWGDGVVLFVPGPDYREYLAFVDISGWRSGFNRIGVPINARGHSIVTSGSNFDYAFFELTLTCSDPEDTNSKDSFVRMVDSGGESYFTVLVEQSRVLHKFFDSAFSPNN
ncbi:hypothetical protein H0W80_02100 [Candidatus Saccharibacteria bacterium]|nr:hypothetical protein [Candidatus Saccharibacteria bacterium]